MFPWYSIEENIALPLKLRGVKKRERLARARELAALVGLEKFLRSYPRELSGGMEAAGGHCTRPQRQPRSRCSWMSPSGTDALTREKMNLEIQRIALATEATVVFVTHDIEEAVFLGDRVVHLTPRPGRIKDIADVPLSRPRAMEVQTGQDFNTVVAQLRASLNQEDDQ